MYDTLPSEVFEIELWNLDFNLAAKLADQQVLEPASLLTWNPGFLTLSQKNTKNRVEKKPLRPSTPHTFDPLTLPSHICTHKGTTNHRQRQTDRQRVRAIKKRPTKGPVTSEAKLDVSLCYEPRSPSRLQGTEEWVRFLSSELGRVWSR